MGFGSKPEKGNKLTQNNRSDADETKNIIKALAFCVFPAYKFMRQIRSVPLERKKI